MYWEDRELSAGHCIPVNVLSGTILDRTSQRKTREAWKYSPPPSKLDFNPHGLLIFLSDFKNTEFTENGI